jgi:hypothetical protein
MVFEREAASPAQTTARIRGMAGWRRLVGLRSRAQRPDVGGQSVLNFRAFARSGEAHAPYKPSAGAIAGVILSDMFDTGYRDVFD